MTDRRRRSAALSRTATSPPDRGEPVEIRLIARDTVTQTLAAQIAAAIPGCPPPRYYPSRKDPGQTLAYLRCTVPAQTAIGPGGTQP
ncbi:hypothetical protein [Streptomyces uncialis]|uniref:hypothetical protein n=1 Tax=Streptomyces uncialis TaxID=1048205 RepID=UPI00340BFCCD